MTRVHKTGKASSRPTNHLTTPRKPRVRNLPSSSLESTAAAQNRAMQERWEAVQASKTPRRLRLVIGMKKRKAVNSYIQAIRDKVRGDTNVMVLYGNGSFPALVKG